MASPAAVPAVPGDPLDRPALRVARRVGLLVVVAVAIAFPFVFTNPATTSIAMFTLIYAGAATACARTWCTSPCTRVF